MVKNTLKLYIIYLCLLMFRKSRFSRQNCQLKFLILLIKPTGTPNQNSRSLPDSFQGQEAIDYLRIAKWTMIEMLIFRDKPLYIVLRAILVCIYIYISFRGSVLNTEHILELVLTSKIWFWTHITFLANGWNFHFLDDFAPMVENFESEFGSGCECKEGTVGLM